MPNWEALPSQGQQWVGDIQNAAQAEGVDPYLFAALVWAESTFNPNAGSSAGARGLAQLMPGTAAGLGVNINDPYQNLLGGARYLSQQLERFGRVDYALAAYNAGPGRVASAGGIPNIDETQNYVRKVLEYWRLLGGGGSGMGAAGSTGNQMGAATETPKFKAKQGNSMGQLLDAMRQKKQAAAGGGIGELKPITPTDVGGLRDIALAETAGEDGGDEVTFRHLEAWARAHPEGGMAEEEEEEEAAAAAEKTGEPGAIQRPAGMNGRLGDDLLTEIGGGFKLQHAAAESWLEMAAAMEAAGVAFGISSAYRTYEHQQRLYAELGDYSQGGLAAKPGRSPHGWGIAMDVSGDAAQRWLAANAPSYGWHTVGREPWHWQFGRTNG